MDVSNRYRPGDRVYYILPTRRCKVYGTVVALDEVPDIHIPRGYNGPTVFAKWEGSGIGWMPEHDVVLVKRIIARNLPAWW